MFSHIRVFASMSVSVRSFQPISECYLSGAVVIPYFVLLELFQYTVDRPRRSRADVFALLFHLMYVSETYGVISMARYSPYSTIARSGGSQTWLTETSVVAVFQQLISFQCVYVCVGVCVGGWGRGSPVWR